MDRARNRKKIATHKYSFLTAYLTQKELKKYNDLGLKWYHSLNLKWGMDLTGKGMSVADKTELSHLNNYERENKILPSVPDRHIDVTFQPITDKDTDKVYDLVLDNGRIRREGYAWEVYQRQQEDKD